MVNSIEARFKRNVSTSHLPSWKTHCSHFCFIPIFRPPCFQGCHVSLIPLKRFIQAFQMKLGNMSPLPDLAVCYFALESRGLHGKAICEWSQIRILHFLWTRFFVHDAKSLLYEVSTLCINYVTCRFDRAEIQCYLSLHFAYWIIEIDHGFPAILPFHVRNHCRHWKPVSKSISRPWSYHVLWLTTLHLIYYLLTSRGSG